MHILDFLLCGISIFMMYKLIKRTLMHQLISWLILDGLIIGLHVFFDSVRWQVIPLYLLPIGVIIYGLIEQIDVEKLKKMVSVIWRTLLSLIVIISVVMIIIMPIPVLMEPDGNFDVGTTVLNLKDSDRVDPFKDIPYRDIRIQIWYPSEKGETYSPWFTDGMGVIQSLADNYGLPRFALNHFKYVDSHAYKDAPVLTGTYPVVILSHGWDSSRVFHTDHAETMASNGYIVIAIDHTYAAATARLENGDIADHDSDLLPDETIQESGRYLIESYRDDINYVAHILPELNEHHRILNGHLDLETLSVMGHSTGGAAVVLYAQDHDVDTVIALEPWVEPVDVQPLEVPTLYFRSEEWSDGTNNGQLSIITDEVYQIEGSMHVDFAMAYTFTPLMVWTNGTSNTSEIQNAFIINFLDHYYKNDVDQAAALLDQYKSVKIKTVEANE